MRKLREKISDLKIQISTITKGIPMSKIELRDDKKPSTKSEAGGGGSTAATNSPAAKHSAALASHPQHKPSLAYLRANQQTANQILNAVAEQPQAAAS